MFKKILVAVDGSEHALRACKVGLDIAKAMHSAVTLVYAAYVPAIYDYDLGPEIRDSLREEGRKILNTAEQVFKESNTDVEQKLLFDEKAEDGIIRLLSNGSFDLVILGSRGLDATRQKSLGSTSLRVLSGANCPVMIVH